VHLPDFQRKALKPLFKLKIFLKQPIFSRPFAAFVACIFGKMTAVEVPSKKCPKKSQTTTKSVKIEFFLSIQNKERAEKPFYQRRADCRLHFSNDNHSQN